MPKPALIFYYTRTFSMSLLSLPLKFESMKVHKLNLEDFEDDLYTLVAIHTRLEEYKLAYNLNRYLNLRLSRSKKDLDLNYLHASFAIYEWKDAKHDRNWTLIANKCQREVPRTVSSGTLFHDENQSETIITYLVPEQKKTDYILKIQGIEEDSGEIELVKSIQQIQEIQTCYTLETEKLKSIKNLITS